MMFRQRLNISKKGDTKNSLGNLCQYSDTPKVKKCILIFRHNFLFSSLCLTSFVLSLGTTEKKKKKPLSVSSASFLQVLTQTLMNSPVSLLLQAEESELSWKRDIVEMFQFLHHLCEQLLDSLLKSEEDIEILSQVNSRSGRHQKRTKSLRDIKSKISLLARLHIKEIYCFLLKKFSPVKH